jgi:hypothetical protein
MNAGDVLINSVGGAAVVFVGTWVISLVRSTKLLDAEAQSTIKAQSERIMAIENERSAISALEQSRRNAVTESLADIDEPFRDLAGSVLRFLLHHGETHQLTLFGNRRFTGQNQHIIQAATQQAQMRGLLRVENGYVSVNPELKDALTFCLLNGPL